PHCPLARGLGYWYKRQVINRKRPWQLCDLRQFLTTYSIISNVSFPSLNLWLGLMKNSQITLKKENIIKNKII
ncbi:hypothetical protein, partial [Klebsiella pneumoniae]|uniref:hypothetical protein n=1 Tax=Klebsiella pneumoniae TaxID=573 RepID=UPI00350F0AE1